MELDADESPDWSVEPDILQPVVDQRGQLRCGAACHPALQLGEQLRKVVPELVMLEMPDMVVLSRMIEEPCPICPTAGGETQWFPHRFESAFVARNLSFSGQFMTRIPPELHRQVNMAARLSGKSLNAWLSEQLQSAVARMGITGDKKAVSDSRNVTKRTGKRRPVLRRSAPNAKGDQPQRGIPGSIPRAVGQPPALVILRLNADCGR